MVEDKTATRLMVLMLQVAGKVTGADTGIPLVPREARTVAVPHVVDITLCDREREREVGRLRKPGSGTRNHLTPQRLCWARPSGSGWEGWARPVCPLGPLPKLEDRIVNKREGSVWWGGKKEAGLGRKLRQTPGNRGARSMSALLAVGGEAGKTQPCSLWVPFQQLLPVVRLRPMRVLREEEAEAGGRVRSLENIGGQVLSENSRCT